MHATIAAWDGDRLTLWDKTQWVHNTADEIAAVFGIPAENIRVISPFVGGAFGSALRTWPHVTLAALGARVAGRPVKVMLSRREMYYGVGYRPHTVQRVALGASRDGRLTAILHEGYQETSTYEEFSEALLNASRFLHSCPNVYTRHRIARMNVHTPTYMRAPGEASGVFALESAMDELAVALNIDPVELRLRNEPEQDEFKKLPFSSRSTRECYRAAAERFGWSRRNPEPRSMRDGRWLIGWGMATATYPMNYAPASAMARLLPDGTAEVTSAASDMGPGTWTSMTQVAAETLGLPIERVKFTLGDTRLPRAPVHGGSMTMASVGSAVQAACRKAREDALARGGANDLSEAMRRLGQPVEASADVKPGDESQRFSMHAFGAVFVEVAVDPDLGETRVRRIVGAYGAGRIVNPKTTRSQCIGGMIGGIGMALMEHSVVDARNGRVPNANFAEYAVPVHADAPPVMDVIFVEEHDPHVNPLGVKGVGEIAMVGVAPGDHQRDLPRHRQAHPRTAGHAGQAPLNELAPAAIATALGRMKPEKNSHLRGDAALDHRGLSTSPMETIKSLVASFSKSQRTSIVKDAAARGTAYNDIRQGIAREELAGMSYMFWGRLVALGMLAIRVAMSLPLERSAAYLLAISAFVLLDAPPYLLARRGIGGTSAMAAILLLDVAILTYILIVPPPFYVEGWTPQLNLRLPNFLYLGVFLVGIVQEIVRKIPSEVLLKQLEGAGIPCAPVNSLGDILADPQVIARGIVQSFGDDSDLSAMKAVVLPIIFNNQERDLGTPPPRLGEHSDLVLGQLGYAPEEIACLEFHGVIARQNQA